jgi:uncharacterized protein
MITDAQMKKIDNYAKEIYKTFNDTHNMSGHINLVLKNVELIAKKERADIGICRAAALLHDIGQVHGHERHEKRSADMATEFLNTIGLDKDTIRETVHCIEAHGSNWEKERSIEAKVVSDADKLEVLGCWGIIRVFEHALRIKNGINDALAFTEKITESAYNSLNTKIAKDLAKPLYENSREFFKLLKKQRGF